MAAGPDERDRMSELRDRIKQVIEEEPVALFMKGTPRFVMCGNSSRALDALRSLGAPVTAVDVLPHPEIRQELSAVSGWPTIPQVFVKGELIGGADICEELAASGALREKLTSALGDEYATGEEKVVDVLAPAQA
jgi:monothiol glutaredoxin